MSKRSNTVLFILGATVFNLLVIVVLMVVAMVILALLDRAGAPQALLAVLALVLFLGSIAGAFVLYSWLVRLLTRRINMDDYFLPLFRPKKR